MVDVSNPAAPTMTGVFDLGDEFPDLVRSGNVSVTDVALSGAHGVVLVQSQHESQIDRLEVVDLDCP